MRISDWSSDVCSSDLREPASQAGRAPGRTLRLPPSGGNVSPGAVADGSLNGPFGARPRLKAARQTQQPVGVDRPQLPFTETGPIGTPRSRPPSRRQVASPTLLFPHAPVPPAWSRFLAKIG